MNAIARRLTDLARVHGKTWYDPATRLCVGPRDTLWYAIALLHSAAAGDRALGEALLAEARSADGTHTPATMLAILLAIPGRITPATATALEQQVRQSLPEAALAEWHDGNVNHPLAAWCALILGGERFHDPLAVASGRGRLLALRKTVGDRRHAWRRQAVFSEYNSLTYTALDLWWLALIAGYAQDPEARRCARFLEERLWIELALFYHAPSQQFAGPHSRSYLDDSLGGWSGVHCTMAVAFGEPIFLEPQRALGIGHPSAILQNTVPAILPFHVPAEAHRLAFHKPMPLLLRATTYGESYHENHVPRGFEDGLYPGGWSDLVSYQTAGYALGTAARPYVNAGHSDAFMVRIHRHAPVRACGDFRSIFARGVFNDAEVHRPNRVHVTGGATDASYLYEEGRTFALQHRNRALMLYAPKGAGHRGVARFRVDVIFSYDAPFDELWLDGRPAGPLPQTLRAGARIVFRDAHTFGVLIPLVPQPAAQAQPVTLRQTGGCLIVSNCNYDGPARDWPRDELRGWRNGFYCELWTTNDFPDLAAVEAHAAAIVLTDTLAPGGRQRRARVGSGTEVLELAVNPWSEEIEQATINGTDARVQHLEVTGGRDGAPLLDPPTLYGSEAYAVFPTVPR
jgi:hypothetical protein